MAVWDEDVQQNSTIADRSGAYALEFMANRTGAMETDYRPVTVGSPYRFVARMRTSLNGANDTVEVTARWYDDTKSLIGAAVPVYASAVLSGAGVWDELAAILNAPANAQYATIRIEKDDATTAYIAYCDFAEVTYHPVAFRARPTANQAFAGAGASVKVQFGTEYYDHGSVFDNAVNYRFTAKTDGLYNISATVFCFTAAAPDVGMWWEFQLYKNGIVDRLGAKEGEVTAILDAGIYQWLRTFSDVFPLAAGDYLEWYFDHNNTANVTVGSGGTLFAAAQIE